MSAQRMVFLTFFVLLMLGIWLTGFTVVHWFLYVPTAIVLFAGLTGICPSMMLYKLMGFK